jgi:hypothetical protein
VPGRISCAAREFNVFGSPAGRSIAAILAGVKNALVEHAGVDGFLPFEFGGLGFEFAGEQSHAFGAGEIEALAGDAEAGFGLTVQEFGVAHVRRLAGLNAVGRTMQGASVCSVLHDGPGTI